MQTFSHRGMIRHIDLGGELPSLAERLATDPDRVPVSERKAMLADEGIRW